MIYERLVLMRDLLAEDGSIYVHCETRVNALIRLAMDEVFGKDNLRSEITWMRTSSHNDASGRYGRVKDTIYFYTKSERAKLNPLYTPYTEDYIAAEWRKLLSGRYYKAENMLDPQGRMAEYDFHGTKARWRATPENMEALWNAPQTEVPGSHGRIKLGKDGNPIKRCRIMFLDEMLGVPLSDLWSDIKYLGGGSKESQTIPPKNPKPCSNGSSRPPPTKATSSPISSAAPALPPPWPKSWAASGSPRISASSPSTPPASG